MGVTIMPRASRSLQRDEPLYASERLQQAEQRAAQIVPRQIALFDSDHPPVQPAPPFDPSDLLPSSSLLAARQRYRDYLESGNRPRNTIEAYTYDLARLTDQIGPKPINHITDSDIATFLGQASNRSTRKRRLTSLRGFFRFLIDDARALRLDPTEGFHPHLVALHTPVVLTETEQEQLLEAADHDEPWSGAAIRLMLRMGLTRGELLQLRREHVTFDAAGELIVSIHYDDASKRVKERRLNAGGDLPEVLAAYMDRPGTADVLFPYGNQAVNGMVDRVTAAAGLDKKVTPQVLRHTFGLAHARAGATAPTLIKLLGLVDEPRNRVSVERYIDMAAPPLRADPPEAPAGE
jgi:integrase/recombinase XerD